MARATNEEIQAAILKIRPTFYAGICGDPDDKEDQWLAVAVNKQGGRLEGSYDILFDGNKVNIVIDGYKEKTFKSRQDADVVAEWVVAFIEKLEADIAAVLDS